MSQLDILTLIVSITQIAGLIAVVVGSGPIGAVITGIAGFAAIVNYFLPSRIAASWHKPLKTTAAVCGVGLVIMAIASVA